MSRLAAARVPAAASVRPSSPALAVRLVTLVALAALTIAAFHGVVRNDWFAVDDHDHVSNNPHVNAGLTVPAVVWELTHADCGNWHPLTMLSHMLDVQLFGLKPAGHHAMSLAWHVLNALLLLLVLHRATGAWWRSALVAAFFAVHPLRVESVAWVAERKDVLSTCFFLLTLGAYVEWARRGGTRWFAFTCAALVLGLLAKPMLVTTPFVLLLLDVWPLGRFGSDAGARSRGHALAARLAEKWPLWIVVGVFSALTLITQRSAGALAIVPGLTWPVRAGNALVTYWVYVRDSLWPRHLVAFVPHTLRLETVGAVLALLALVLATVLALRARRRPWLALGWFWYVGTLVPVIGLVQFGPHARADRFTYVPAIGLAILVVWEVAALVERVRIARLAAVAAAGVAIAALALATDRQVGHWRDTRTMYEWIVRVLPSNTTIRWWLADQYLTAGEPTRALAEYERVQRELPGRASLHTDIAAALSALGRDAEAREHLAIVTQRAPDATAWHDLARMDARLGRTEAAAAELDSALAYAPGEASAWADRAVVLARMGRSAAAAEHAARAVALAPAQVEYRRLLAETARDAGRFEAAIGAYAGVLAARPDDVNAALNRAWLLATVPAVDLRNGAEALRLAERVAAAPDSPAAAAEATRAAALAELGRFAEAARAGERAVASARAAGSRAEASEYARQLAGYRAGRPCREVAHQPAAGASRR